MIDDYSTAAILACITAFVLLVFLTVGWVQFRDAKARTPTTRRFNWRGEQVPTWRDDFNRWKRGDTTLDEFLDSRWTFRNSK